MIRPVRCPTCRRPAATTPDNPWRPFCSERCRLIDLGAWMDESRRIPSNETAPGDPAASASEPLTKH